MEQINDYKADIQKAIKCLEAIRSSERYKLPNYEMSEQCAADVAITSLKATSATLEHPETLHGVNYVLLQAISDLEMHKYANSHDFYPAFDECIKIIARLLECPSNQYEAKRNEDAQIRLSALDFMNVVVNNLNDLISKAQKDIDEAVDAKDKYEHAVYKTCLEFTRRFTTELYHNIIKEGK